MDWLEMEWKLLVTRGVIGIVFGIVAMAWPMGTAVTLIVLWGVWALVDGVGTVAAAFRVHGGAAKAAYGAIGVLSLAAAFFALFRPTSAVVALTWILGLWLIARGCVEAIEAVRGTTEGSRWIRLVGAALSMLAGALFVANPGSAAVALAFWLGLVALLWGITFLVAGLLARRAAQGETSRSAVPIT